MAKDPAFLFYDADAAKDVSHMNRLERGAYFDLIQAQRKFRGYTVEQARKILGRDFDEVWPALELILGQDELGLFYIEWVRESMEKRTKYSEKQRLRIQDYWDKKKKKYDDPSLYRGITADIPYVNENAIVNTEVNTFNEIPKWENMIVVEMMKVWKGRKPGYAEIKNVDYPALLIIAYYIAGRKGWTQESVVNINEINVLDSWKTMVDFIIKDNFFCSKTLSTIGSDKMMQNLEESMKGPPKEGNRQNGESAEDIREKRDREFLQQAMKR